MQQAMVAVILLFVVPVLSGSLTVTDPHIVQNEIVNSYGILTAGSSISSLDSADPVDVFCLIGTDFDVNTSLIMDRFDTDKLAIYLTGSTGVRTVYMTHSSVLNDNRMQCDMVWGDGVVTNFDFKNSTPVVHTYAQQGVYRISARCRRGSNTKAEIPVQDTSYFVTTSFFDYQHKNIYTPMIFLQTESVQIQANINLTGDPGDQPTMYWRLIHVVNTSFIEPLENFTQPESITLFLKPGSLAPGDYVVIFELIIPGETWGDDFVLLRVIEPDIMTLIEGGDYRSVPHGLIHYVNGTHSQDPSPADDGVPLQVTWTCGVVNYGQARNQPFFKSPYAGSVSSVVYKVIAGSDIALKLDTSFFSANSWIVVMLTLQRGNRKSMAVQFLQLVPNSLPFLVRCIFNCNNGRDRKFIYERIELDTIFEDPLIDTSTFDITWSVVVMTATNSCKSGILFAPPTGYKQPSFKLVKGSLKEGCDYEIRVVIVAPGYSTSFNFMLRNAGIRPYGGACFISPESGYATIDMFTIVCENWNAIDYRVTKDAVKDPGGVLRFKALQTTTGAVVPSEPIVETRYPVFDVILKVGDPNADYLNTVVVDILDVNKNMAVVHIAVTVYPVLNVSDVTANSSGADQVHAFRDIYKEKKMELYQLARIEHLLPLAISVCSQLHLVELPEFEPPVPPKLNTDGYIVDLNPDGNKDLGGIETAMEDNQRALDPASVAMQEVLEELAEFMQNLTYDYIVNHEERKYDPLTKSLLTNLVNNIAGEEQFVNTGTKIVLINLGELIGLSSLEDILSGAAAGDMGVEIENAADEVADMYHTVAKSSVPNSLRNIRPVVNLLAGRQQIADMLTASPDTFDLDHSDLSEDERAYLYMKMQQTLRYSTDQLKEEARASARMARRLMKSVQENIRLCDRCDNTNHTRTQQLLVKNTALELSARNFSLPHASFQLGGLEEPREHVHVLDSSHASVSATEFSENMFMYDDDGKSSFVSSNILHIDVKADDTYVTPGYVTFEMTVPTPTPEVTAPLVDPDDVSELSLHRFLYQSVDDTVCFLIQPVSPGDIVITQYPVYIKFEQAPTILDYDVLVYIEQSRNWELCVTPVQMKSHSGLTHIGIHVPGNVKEVNYTFTLITVECLVWDETIRRWLSDKCDLEWLPVDDKIRCFCRDVTEMTFGNSFYVPPNTIDFSTVFLKFSPLDQAAVMGTLAGIFIIFLISCLILRRLDKRDVLKWSVTPLLDNKFGAENFYLVQVFTGMRRGAGTKSHVGINLTGDLSDTGIRHLYDGIREEYSTGSVVTFLMATIKPLGRLEHLYIWHDNTGEGDLGPWYLDNVTVYDVSRKTTSIFVAERWLSVDTSCDAKINAISQDTKLEFETRFFGQARQQLSDNHMWMSILYRPQSSSFTRVQRAACALCFILLSMIANAMYFNPNSELQTPPLFQAGPFRFTGQQLYVSIICAAITTPAVMFLVFLFKHVRPPSNIMSNSSEPDNELPSETPDSGQRWCCRRGSNQSRKYKTSDTGLYMHEAHAMDRIQLQKDCNLNEGVPITMSGFSLHYRFFYVSWLIVAGCVVTCSFFIMLYSMEWGKQKSEEWLSSICMSILESMIVIDPILVLCMSVVLACLIHKGSASIQYDADAIVNNYKVKIGHDKVGVAECLQLLKSIKWDYDPSVALGPPPTGSHLEEASQKARLHHNTSSMMWNLLLNLWFMLLVLGICYSNRNAYAYNYQKYVIDQFVKPSTEAKFVDGPKFMDIQSRGDFFTWFNTTALSELFPEYDINGAPLHWTFRQYMEGTINYRVGPPRLRQLRVPKEICEIPYVGTVSCYDKYSIPEELTDDLCIGWTAKPCSAIMTVYNTSLPAWSFTSALDLWGLPIAGKYNTYGGGGYVANFDVSRSISVIYKNELFYQRWLDKQSRAVLLEFTVYNAASELFLYCEFIVEFPETGSAIPSYKLYPLRPQHPSGPTGAFVIFLEVMFCLHVIAQMVKLSIRCYQNGWRMILKFWIAYDVAMCIMCLVAGVLFFIRFFFANQTMNTFNEDKKSFVNFAHIVFWDSLFLTFGSTLVFMATLRILEVFASSKKVGAVVRILTHCRSDLLQYSLFFAYILVGFSLLGNVLFGDNLAEYRNIYRSLTTLFLSILGKNRFSEMDEGYPVLAKAYFIMYTICVVFFIVTMFLSTLGESVDMVVHDMRHDTTDDILDYLGKQIRLNLFGPVHSKTSRTNRPIFTGDRIGKIFPK